MIETNYLFPQGIPGFEDYKVFRLVEEEDVPLAQLISEDDSGIGFILMRPGVIFPDYFVEVDTQNVTVLKLKSIIKEKTNTTDLKEVEHITHTDIWAIVTLNQRDMSKTTINLRAPILLNMEQKLGVQLILSDDRYLARQPLALGELLARVQEGAVG